MTLAAAESKNLIREKLNDRVGHNWSVSVKKPHTRKTVSLSSIETLEPPFMHSFIIYKCSRVLITLMNG